VQIAVYRPDLEAGDIRGNVDTRLRKVSDGEFAGVILAAAGLRRLGIEDRVTEYLTTDHFLPAPGQGAVAIETRRGDSRVSGIVSRLNDLPAWQCVSAERAFLLALGGGCRAPIAALGTVSENNLILEGMVADVSSRQVLRSSEEGSNTTPEALGVKLAQKLLGMGADKFIIEAEKL